MILNNVADKCLSEEEQLLPKLFISVILKIQISISNKLLLEKVREVISTNKSQFIKF